MFAAVKTIPMAAAAYGVAFGWLQWLAGGAQLGIRDSVAIAMDATDLIALPALLIAYMVGKRRGEA